MIVCIDTNALLPILSIAHPHGVILDGFIEGRFHWAISNEILTEYREIAEPRIGPARWIDLVTILESIGRIRSTLLRISPSYRHNLIVADPDDNKFADCAIIAAADFIITEDKHFRVLAGSGYKPQAITPAAFIAQYLTELP